MSFGENLQYLRKMSEMTQEELAERANVSRQTVSKWESGASYPEMEKILLICTMFSCTMDDLLRGSVECSRAEDSAGYDKHFNKFSREIAGATFIILLGVSIMQCLNAFGMNEDLTAAIFMCFVMIAVAIYIVSGLRHGNFVEKHPYITPFYTDEEKDGFKNKFAIYIAAPTVAILVGVVMMMVCTEVLERPAAFDTERWEYLTASGFMLIVAISVYFYVYSAMQYSKYHVDDYNRENSPDEDTKRENILISKWSGCIMLIATIIFVVAGLQYDLWDKAWIVYVVGGILCWIVSIIVRKEGE